MDTEVGRGVGVSSMWAQAGAGRASTADACGAPVRGDAGAVSLRSGELALVSAAHNESQLNVYIHPSSLEPSFHPPRGTPPSITEHRAERPV